MLCKLCQMSQSIERPKYWRIFAGAAEVSTGVHPAGYNCPKPVGHCRNICKSSYWFGSCPGSGQRPQHSLSRDIKEVCCLGWLGMLLVTIQGNYHSLNLPSPAESQLIEHHIQSSQNSTGLEEHSASGQHTNVQGLRILFAFKSGWVGTNKNIFSKRHAERKWREHRIC